MTTTDAILILFAERAGETDQPTTFAVVMTVIGLCGLVVGVILFYHFLVLYIDSLDHD